MQRLRPLGYCAPLTPTTFNVLEQLLQFRKEGIKGKRNQDGPIRKNITSVTSFEKPAPPSLAKTLSEKDESVQNLCRHKVK